MFRYNSKKTLISAVFVGGLCGAVCLTTPSYASNASGATIFDISTMQEMTATICENTTTPNAVSGYVEYDNTGYRQGDANYTPRTTLVDTRDGTEYTIVKLADGNCWMQSNLALGTSDPNGLTLTPDDSDVSSNWTLPAYDEYGTTWSDTDSTPHVIQGQELQEWGNYYTYNTATAGTGTNLTSGEATASICPKGWQLADNSGSKSFANLAAAYGVTNSEDGGQRLHAHPLLFSDAGFYDYYNGMIAAIYTYGFYWSSSAYDETSAWGLTFSASDAYAQYYDCRSSGSSVRCVASADDEASLIDADSTSANSANANSTADGNDTAALGTPDTGENDGSSLNEVPIYLAIVAIISGGLTFGVIRRKSIRHKVSFNAIREY